MIFGSVDLEILAKQVCYGCETCIVNISILGASKITFLPPN